MPTSLPTDIDATYPDDGGAARKAHQQHHDALHGYTNTHDAAPDPHPQYLTSTEADALFLTPAEGSAAFAVRGALDRVVLPASTFTPLGGSPAMGAVNVLTALLFDGAAIEEAGSVATVPAIWATFDILLWWTNAGAGSGNVVWRADHAVTNENNTLTRVINPIVTLAAPAQGVVNLSVLAADVARAAFPLVHVNAVRLGSNAADTLANDAALLAVELRKKTYS